MACNVIHSWTVSLFIASFLKLALACLLLWVAWVSFIAAKFMSFFGLHLPCTCNDFIEDQNSGVENLCVQAALVEYPGRMISSTGSSVLHKFPFEGICACEGSCSSSTVNTRVVNNASIGGPFDRSPAVQELLRNDPCHWNSVGPEDWQSINRRGSLEIQDMQTEITEVKSDYCSCHAVEESKVCRQQGRCPHCFCNSFHNNGNCRCSSKWKVNQGALHDWEATSSSLHGDEQKTVIGKGDTKSFEDGLMINELPGASDAYATSTEKKDLTSEDWCQPERTLSLIELDGLINSGEERGEQGDLLKALEAIAIEQISQGDKQDILNDFKEALKAEREARKALYLELEKERNAAATAAEETMAMISRLQKDKASIEMEARQFKRMAEEKSVYDEEAIEILKEILVRREREKLDLEDEVDMYRQNLLRDGTDKWERISCNGSEEYSKENSIPSLQEGHEFKFLIGREFDCCERQEAGADENNLLSMDARHRVEKQLDKLHAKEKHVAPFDGRDLLKSFHLVANENPLDGIDECQVPQTEGHMISFASQDPKGKAFLENDKQELMKPIKVAMDKDLSQQHDGRKDLLEQMIRSEEQLGLMHSREAKVMNSSVKEGGLQLEKYFKERNSFETLPRQEYDGMKGSLSGNGLYNSDVGILHITEDISNHTLEDDSSTRDVHVVLDNIQNSTQSDSEDTKVSSLKTTSDRHEKSDLLQRIARIGELDGILHTMENNVLMEGNSAAIPFSYENENPASSESKASKTGLDLESGYLHKNRVDRTSSHGLHTKSLFLRDNARMKVENEVECLAGRLRALEASRENAILPVGHVKKEKAQLQHLEETSQHHRDMQTSEDGLKYA